MINTTFSYIVAVSFIGGGKPECREKTTDLSQVTDKLYHIKLYRVYHIMNEARTHNLVVIGNDCTGSCKSSYHTIMPSAALLLYLLYYMVLQFYANYVYLFFAVEIIPVVVSVVSLVLCIVVMMACCRIKVNILNI